MSVFEGGPRIRRILCEKYFSHSEMSIPTISPQMTEKEKLRYIALEESSGGKLWRKALEESSGGKLWRKRSKVSEQHQIPGETNLKEPFFSNSVPMSSVIPESVLC